MVFLATITLSCSLTRLKWRAEQKVAARARIRMGGGISGHASRYLNVLAQDGVSIENPLFSALDYTNVHIFLVGGRGPKRLKQDEF